MGYVIAAILVLLLVAGFVTFFVLNSMRKGSGEGAQDPSAGASGHSGAPGIGGDETPLGDTTEHAGEQSEEGVTDEDPEAADRGHDPAGSAGEHDPESDGPSRPARPEDRQLRDAGADA
jgi:hypothetical protein